MEKKTLEYWCSKPINEIYKILETDEKGLSFGDVSERLQRYGPNSVISEEKSVFFRIFVSQFKNWLIVTLLISTVIAFFLGEKTDSLVILSLIFISVGLGFFQEFKASKVLEKLKKYVVNKSFVVRNGSLVEIDAKDIVPGDIVNLDIGDRIPADIRLISTKDLSLNETLLTGESGPAEKNTDLIGKRNLVPQDADNMVFMGTFVGSGSGLGVVVETGKNTFLGKTSELLRKNEEMSDFEVEAGRFSLFLFRTVIFLVSFIFIVNSILGKGVFDSFLFALALAVGITPELLPAITSVSLSTSAILMAKKKVIVKKLVSVEDLGNMDVLCTDKTGTLTKGELLFKEAQDLDGNSSDEILLYALLTSDEFMNKGGRVIENQIDQALWKNEKAKDLELDLPRFTLIDKDEFNFETKRASVLVSDGDKKYQVSKGAVESMMRISSKVVVGGKEKKMDDKLRKNLRKKFEDFEKFGYKVIVVAKREIKDKCLIRYDNLIICGMILFEDPVKETAKDSIAQLVSSGVRIVILSGDDSRVVEKIATETAVVFGNKKAVSGEELEEMDDTQFRDCVCKCNLFSRLTPEQKYNIVKALNEEGKVVGFLGDGINDSPALKAADVGIAVDSGAAIAKEAADIVLLSKDLNVLIEGIKLGRTTFANITKYILNTISANFGNMSTVALSSVFLKFIPLLPSQILLNNLISDIPLLAIVSDAVDKNLLNKPKHWDIKLIGKFMAYFGILSSIFDLGLILAMTYLIKVDPVVFRTAWFIESSLSEIIITFSIRTKLAFYKSKPSPILLGLSIFSIILVISLPFVSPGKILFSFTNLPRLVWLFIFGDLLLYFISCEIIKKEFYKRFGA